MAGEERTHQKFCDQRRVIKLFLREPYYVIQQPTTLITGPAVSTPDGLRRYSGGTIFDR